MQKYNVRRLHSVKEMQKDILSFSEIAWEEAEEGLINIRNWEEYDHVVDSRFYLLYSDYSIYVLLLTKGEAEREPLTTVKAFQGPVHNDSCLEFFFSFEPERSMYMNIETNSVATKYIAIGEAREDRYKLSLEEANLLQIEAVPRALDSLRNLAFDYDWGVFIHIPLSLLAKFWPSIPNEDGSLKKLVSEQEIAANFYKCGDEAKPVHFLSWSEIISDEPDFHRPECFGRLVLE